MRIHLLAVGAKMPDWVVTATEEYAGRMPAHCQLVIKEIPAAKRTRKSERRKIMETEGQKLLAAIPEGAVVVALDVLGKSWSSEQLSQQLDDWMFVGRDVVLLVGGPDGLSPACLQRADMKWSLSDLTLPHPLVRVVIAEQLFRAWSILTNHPYHRAD
ncbi:MAG: 23S rRNA (pseudouridine(1915)-N(3))-methyltransferase RlmH [Thiotrichales bacterium]|nr:MAG: 23S rRNA (pseudouridine(1915)-N(3))-methyltransferase RlmH [Thiotrichales bacterium]